jgi:hypothetical protein
MSKLAQQINATITNTITPLVVYNSSISMDLTYTPTPYATKVRFMVHFGKEYFISDELLQDGSAIQNYLNNIRKEVIEEVFGEFKKPIMEIRDLLYCRRYDTAVDKLEALERQMFSV